MAAHFGGGDVPGAALVRCALGRLAAEGEAAWVDWILCELVAHCARVAGEATAWGVLLGGLSLGALEEASVRQHLQVRPRAQGFRLVKTVGLTVEGLCDGLSFEDLGHDGLGRPQAHAAAGAPHGPG